MGEDGDDWLLEQLQLGNSSEGEGGEEDSEDEGDGDEYSWSGGFDGCDDGGMSADYWAANR